MQFIYSSTLDNLKCLCAINNAAVPPGVEIFVFLSVTVSLHTYCLNLE